MTSYRMKYKIGATQYHIPVIDDLSGFGSGGGVPLGTILPYSADSLTHPEGFSFCDGTAVSRSLYADLFDLIGTSYGAGDGETTFNLPDLTDAAWLNGSYEKTAYETAGNYTFTATKPGWYKITIKGAGGGGAGCQEATAHMQSSSGGEGGTTFAYECLVSGDIISVIVGAGGTGGTAGGGVGGNGGDSTVSVNSTTYVAGGGGGGRYGDNYRHGGVGGTGDIVGAPGAPASSSAGADPAGTSGGGNGGGVGLYISAGGNGVSGGGGAGAAGTNPGGNGGDGYCWIEYIGTSQNFIIRTFDEATPSSAQIDLSQYTNALNNKADKADGVPVGTVLPFSGNGSLPAGYLLCDGSAVSRSMYEDLFGVIGTTYGEGDGVETFNLPDLGFIDSESKYPVVFGNTYANSYNGSTIDLAYASTDTKSKQASLLADSGGVTFFGSSNKVSFDSSTLDGFDYTRSVTGYNRVSPLYTDLSSNPSTIKYLIKAFNGMNTHGALLDLTGMANDLNQKFDPRSDFCYIYPNGGSEGSPANVTANSRYVESNPFAGYSVYCVAEIFYNNEWGRTGWASDYVNGKGYGVLASRLDDNNIVICSGSSLVMTSSGNSGNPFNFSGSLSTAPCRVKVWKIGKI